jgi:hypothetical protein
MLEHTDLVLVKAIRRSQRLDFCFDQCKVTTDMRLSWSSQRSDGLD